MSLNHKEIDLILEELDLAGSWVQKILQPSYDAIIFELYGKRGPVRLLASIAPGACRLHELSAPTAKNERPLRFMECLRSRLKGAKISSARQLGDDRIVVMDLTVSEDGQPREYRLYFRFWSGAGNIVLVDSTGTVVDALVRKPDKGEVSGQKCSIEEDSLAARASREPAPDRYGIRDLPGDGSFNSRVENFYATSAGALSLDRLKIQAKERHDKKTALIERRLDALRARKHEYEHFERFRQIGDILIAGGYSYEKVPRNTASSRIFVETYDFYREELVKIQIDGSLTQAENAAAYYEKYRKAESGLEDVAKEITRLESEIAETKRWLESVEEEEDPFAVAKALQKGGTVREKPQKRFPCLWIERDEWILLIGRSAKENDELLRHYAKGADLWLHARDWAGSYVFIKSRKGKTYPLELLLDAGMLALYYSSARKNMDGDVYYTPVKYLRRVKDGPKGLVIPTMEKNLRVSISLERIKALLSGAQSSGGEI